MKKHFKEIVAFGLLVTAGAESVAVADDLFSEIRGTSVFVSQSSDNGASRSTGLRITNPEEIARLLREAGLEAAVNEGKSVSTTKEIDSWEFPVLVMISESEREISVVLGLSSIQDAGKVPANRLLGLLEANQKYSSSRFVFNPARQRTELVGMLQNEAVTGLKLRDEISRLAILARDTEDLWNLNPAEKPAPVADPEKASTDATAPVTPPVPATSPEGSVASLKGSWSAVKSSTEAFAIEFRDNETFVLVYVNQGKQTRSSGTFQRTLETLTLSGENGFKLSGALKTVSDAEFQFRPASTAGNSDPLTFKRAK
jgi:hypothetical protein